MVFFTIVFTASAQAHVPIVPLLNATLLKAPARPLKYSDWIGEYQTNEAKLTITKASAKGFTYQFKHGVNEASDCSGMKMSGSATFKSTTETWDGEFGDY